MRKINFVSDNIMTSRSKIITWIILAVVGIGTFVLWTADIPAPSKKVSKTLSDDRFQ